MDVFTALRIAVVRWFITLPVLALTVFAAYQQYDTAESSWTARGSLLLLAPTGPSEPDAAGQTTLVPVPDPLIQSAGGARLLAGLLVSNLNNPARAQLLFARGATEAYNTATTRDAPIVNIGVTGDSAEATARTLEVVLAGAEDVLVEVQSDLGGQPAGFYRLVPASPATAPAEVPAAPERTIIAMIAGGALLAVVLAVVVDRGLAGRERARRSPPGGRGEAISSAGPELLRRGREQPALTEAGASGAADAGRL